MAESPRAGHLRRTYGITEAQYDVLLKFQGGKCFICRRPPAKRRLEVDHDHKSGLIRGLLCWFCNKKVIGSATDPAIFARATEYLTDPPARHLIGGVIVPPKKRKRRTRRNK